MHLKKCGIDRKTESSKFRGTKTFRVRQNVACILKMSSALPFKFFKNTFRCFYCSKDCSDFDVLREHTLKYHGQFDQECAAMKKIKGKDLIVKIEITNLTCKICYEQFMGLIDLIDHIVTKHGANYDNSVECVQIFKISKDNIPCPICPDSYFGYFKKLLEHMNEHHSNNNIVCVYCGVTFRGHSNYRAHISRYHRRKACTCPECKKDFWNLEKLARHKANVHDEKGPPKTLSPNALRRQNLLILFNNTTVIPFKCRGKCRCFYCGEEIPVYDDLKKHTKAHGPCTELDRAIKLIKTDEAEVKVDVSDVTCEVCNKRYSNVDEIVTHLIDEHKLSYNRDVKLIISTYRLKDLRCLLCENQKFKVISKLVAHVNNDHPNQNVNCDVCNQTFNKKGHLDAHMRFKHKSSYKCLKCCSNFNSYGALQEHKLKSHAICNICFVQFSSQKRRLKHMKVEHANEALKCGFCLKSMRTRLGFLRHAAKCTVKSVNKSEQRTFIIDDDQKKPSVVLIRNNIACILNMSTAIPFKYFMSRFRCFYCTKNFSDCQELREHTVVEHPICDVNFKCMRLRNRQEDFDDCEELKVHSSSEHPLCTTEIKSMKLRNRLDGGIKVDISFLSCAKLSTVEDKYKKTEMVHPDVLREHTAKVHQFANLELVVYDRTKNNRNRDAAVKIDVTDICCKLCNKNISSLEQLINHLIIAHDAEYDVSVPNCLLPFKLDKDQPTCPGENHLKMHNRYYHREGGYTCDQCGINLSTLSKKMLHEKNVHMINLSTCPHCPETFKSPYFKKLHLANVHGVEELKIKCPYCPKVFPQDSIMSRHMRRVHLREKNVECQICGDRFFGPYDVKLHMLKHNGDKKFICSVCGKKFSKKSYLNSHMVIHTGQKKYVCTVCGKEFAHRPNLRIHFRTRHPQYEMEQAVSMADEVDESEFQIIFGSELDGVDRIE
ncbi:zinc finger protein 729 [Danaus plexippus plexippus]|uniref:Zinc finger protein 729 n=1 Tax=Danaus plexippus plexippus TaxID=278856 RepID=A0A212ESL2_DANPL|nr:zinc finger protein 729 [Danaus plexippus plexippus]